MSSSRVCIVTDELYPFTAGGIGRLVHNLVSSSLQRAAPVEFHLLLPSTVQVQPAQVELYFQGRVRVHVCAFRSPQEQAVDAHGVYPPPAALRHSRWHAESLDMMRHLKALEASGLRFDVIEFPDFHGWAFCTLQERLLGLAFQSTLVSVRLHSSYGVLTHYEPSSLEVENLGRVELERKALLDADRIIAHLPCVGDFNERFYGFDEAWRRKVVVEFPPVAEPAPAPQSLPPGVQRNLLFITKIQSIKRPDLFVRAAALLMRTWPEYQGRAVLACHAFDPGFLEQIKALVPADLAHRFIFSKPGPDREQLMRTGVVVITSDYESLNLTAYEASVAGARLVLNGACLAFGDDSPFVDGVNCCKYDGSLDGLAEAMRRALEGPEQQPVTWNEGRPYWEALSPVAAPAPLAEPLPLVSVVITNFNLARYLPAALASIAASSYPEVEIVLVDDASTEPFDHTVLERLERSAAEGQLLLRVVRSPINRGLPAARNLGVRAARGRYVLPLDADDCIAPDFLARAVAALEAQPDFSGVIPTAGYFHSEEELSARRFVDFATFLGDCPTYALVNNRISCATALLRRSLFEKHSYDESLTSYEDWELYLRLVQGGHRFLVTNQVQFFYRRRMGSMVSSLDKGRHFRLLSRMYETVPRPLHSSVRLFALLAHAREAMVDPMHALHHFEPSPVASMVERPVRHEVIDVMNAALKRLPLVHPLLKQAMSLARSRRQSAQGSEGSPRPLRYEVVDQLNTTLKQFPALHSALKRATGRAS